MSSYKFLRSRKVVEAAIENKKEFIRNMFINGLFLKLIKL